MKIEIIGSHLCPDTLYALHKLKERNIEFDFLDLSASFLALKQYLDRRDTAQIFEPVKKSGRLGIPLFVIDDFPTFDLADLLKIIQAGQSI